MNVHHLELFYYVARHGGITAAVRHIPYGIQQPAVSGQMRALEEDAGTKLFERSPFRLTPAGEKLWAHVQPFFEGLDRVADDLRKSGRPELRVAGAEIVLRDHLPAVLQRLKKRFPGLRFSLRITGFMSEVGPWLREGQVDIALVPLADRPMAPLRQERLARFPLVLQVPRRSGIKSADELWAKRRLDEPLICLPADTTIARNFQRDLKRKRVVWPQAIEATSLDLVTRYVANGDGLGVNVQTGSRSHRDVTHLPLPGFTPVVMGAIWCRELSAPAGALVEELRDYARVNWPKSST